MKNGMKDRLLLIVKAVDADPTKDDILGLFGR